MTRWPAAIVLLTFFQARNEADVDAQLQKLKSGFVQDRVDAATRLGEWVRRPSEGAAAGFSDKTVDRAKPPPVLTPELRDKAATALAEAANDVEPKVREAASKGLAGLSGKRPALQSALLRALQSKDKTVVWYVLQAFDEVLPEAEAAVPVLIPLLDLRDDNSRASVMGALGRYGPKAKAAAAPLLRLVSGATKGSYAPYGALSALAEIGIDGEQAAALAALKLEGEKELEYHRFEVLAAHPKVAVAYIKDRPDLFAGMISPLALLRVVESTDPEGEPLRKALLDLPELPPVVMAWSGEARFLPRIKELLKKADPHQATFLAACARACGQLEDRTVALGEKQPGNFKPKSAWPGTDASRRGDGGGHGDGFTPVLVTGRLQMADGSPPVLPRFINENDRMMLGTRTDEPGPLRYDSKTGRFAFYTTVFAAYAMGGGQKQPGPYQTGSAQVRIESRDSKRLVVHFYDEMPDVRITLPAAK